jgi:transposase
MGLPVAFALTGGEASDFKDNIPLLNADRSEAAALLADKGYDADCIRDDIENVAGWR